MAGVLGVKWWGVKLTLGLATTAGFGSGASKLNEEDSSSFTQDGGPAILMFSPFGVPGPVAWPASSSKTWFSTNSLPLLLS